MTGRHSVPYASATTGDRARAEITSILRQFGCSKVGFMDDFATGNLTLQFDHRGQAVRLDASAQGWAAYYLKENPWTWKRRSTKEEWKAKALAQGMIAVNSVLRDWIKGQITAIETGILNFDEVFMPHFLLPSGETVKKALMDPGRGGLRMLEAPRGAE